MTSKLKEYYPDTPEEWHLIAKYVRNLGTAMSGVLLFAANEWWVLGSLFLTWGGESLADYLGHPRDNERSNKIIPTLILFVLIAWLLSSCVTYNKCLDKFGEKKPQPIVLRDTVKVEVPVPGQSMEGTVPCDQPVDNNQLTVDKEATPQDTITQISDNGKAQIKFWRDEYNKLKYKLDCLPDTVLVHVPVEIKGECPDVVVVDEKNASWLVRSLAYYRIFAGWALLLLLIALGVWLKTRPNKTIMYVEKDTTKDN